LVADTAIHYIIQVLGHAWHGMVQGNKNYLK